MNATAETIRPGLAWNATRVASALMVVIIAVIALAFWPALDTSDAAPPVAREANAPAAPHDHVVVDGEVCPQCLP